MKSPVWLEETRNGLAYVYPEPVLTVYRRPWERVLWNAQRNANPFFHIMEAFWMLAGRRDVAFLVQFNRRMREYSDDGINLHGAYGHRWHYEFNFNQLDAILHHFKDNPNSRQEVLTMWSPYDLTYESKDRPCNTHIYFRLTPDVLNMTVCCRSNDMLWGAYGANSVHFSFLHEYMATSLSVQIGHLYQFSNNFHLYKEASAHLIADGQQEATDFYVDSPYVNTMPLVTNAFTFLHEVRKLIWAIEKRDWMAEFTNEFLYTPLLMAEAWLGRTKYDKDTLWQILDKIPAPDWQLAAKLYMEVNCVPRISRKT
jgi:thymidylate synthase